MLWVTLTSGVGAKEGDENRQHKKLRRDMQELRRRVADRWSVAGIKYVCVETMEGNGVLHMLWGAKADKGQFYIPYKWLSQEWEEIHGAWNVWVARVRDGKSSLRRLSRYIVSQYCGGQDGLVRLSQSRMGQPFGAMRRGLLKAMKACTNRFLYYGRLGTGWDIARFGRICNQWYWHEFRHAWDDLVLSGECVFFEDRRVWWAGELCEV